MTKLNKLLLFLILISTVFLYLPGINGPLFFDDFPNLGGLASADNTFKKLDFIFSGQSGPTGRPVALATFALQQSYWEGGADVILLTNVVIHSANGLLVFFLAYLICLNQPQLREKREFISLLACALWVLNPFLVSSSLVMVQRMTLISGFFTFLGLLIYVLFRARYKKGGFKYLIFAVFSLSLCTLLSGFSKENGFLTPILALLIEYFLFSRHWPRVGRDKYLYIVLLMLLGYVTLFYGYLLFYFFKNIDAVGRDFSLLERALTQPWILLDYLFNLLFPRASNAAPFNDDYKAVTHIFDLRLAGGFLIWLAVMIALKRIASPVVSFGVFFFLLAHSLESSVIYLELYFPHRNYVPSFGIAFAIAGSIGVYAGQYRRAILASMVPYISLIVYVLWLVVTTWSQPRLAAEIWAGYKEDSSRAQHFLASQLLEAGEHANAAHILEKLIRMNPESGVYKAQRIAFCFFDPSQYESLKDDFLETISIAKAQNGLGPSIDLIADQIASSRCENLDDKFMQEIYTRSRENENLSKDIFFNAALYGAMAKVALVNGEHERFRSFMLKMFDCIPNLDIGLSAVYDYIQLGDIASADSLLQKLRTDAPSNPIRAWIWSSRIDALEEEIRALVQDNFKYQ